MLSAEQNERLTRVGPGTPGGELLRRYWQPVELTEALDPQRPVRPIRVLGQDLVLFRDPAGRLALLDRDCPHRGADLAYGRIEDGGLRCPFHGWLFDADGACLQTPAEPPGSTLCTRIRQRAYPVVEKSGIVFAYLGEGEPPALPALDCLLAPPPYTFAFKGWIECNWLQALEVGIDPAHASFLHRFFEDEDVKDGYGRQFRAASADSEMPMTRVMREFTQPTIDVRETPYGLQLRTLRKLSDTTTHVRVTNCIFPQAFVIPLSAEISITQFHVPIDDVNNYWYAIFTSFGAPVDRDKMRAQRLELYELPDYRPRINKRNRYGFDPHEQATRTYTGMGMDINVHDQWAVESQGPIQDRTREHLGTTDRAIMLYRRLLARAIGDNEQGARPLMCLDAEQAAAIRGPVTVDGMAAAGTEGDYADRVDAARRAGSSWARELAPRAA
ncbi:MAG: Rieske 2Fe-2S domain-containing protein [Lautropia sp.]